MSPDERASFSVTIWPGLTTVLCVAIDTIVLFDSVVVHSTEDGYNPLCLLVQPLLKPFTMTMNKRKEEGYHLVIHTRNI